jgi:hypothetical protein
VTGWIMTRPDQLTDADRASLDAILAASPELAAATAAVRAFAVIMTERRGRKLLEPWMAAAAATGEPALHSFVREQEDRSCTGRLTGLPCKGLVSAGPFCFPRVDLGKRFKIHPAYIPRPVTNDGRRLHLAAFCDEPDTRDQRP